MPELEGQELRSLRCNSKTSLRKPKISQRHLWGDVFNQSPGRRLRDLQISLLWDVSETLMRPLQHVSEMHPCRLGIYFEALDTVISCITSRFNKKDYFKYAKMESLLLLAASIKEFQQSLSDVCNFYGGNFNRCRWETQFMTLGTVFHSENSKAINVSTVINYLRKLSKKQKLWFSEVVTLAKLILVSFAINAVGERSYSTMQRIKTLFEDNDDSKSIKSCR